MQVVGIGVYICMHEIQYFDCNEPPGPARDEYIVTFFIPSSRKEYEYQMGIVHAFFFI